MAEKKTPKPRPSRAAPSRQPGRVVQLPTLRGCPKCSLPIQAGDNPDRLAFHDCKFVLDAVHSHPATLEGIRQAALNRLRDALPTAAPADVIKMLGLLDDLEPGRRGRRGKGEAEEPEKPDDVRSFLGAGSSRP